jgi:hypothetical protein
MCDQLSLTGGAWVCRVEKGVLTLMVRKTEGARTNERDVNID